MDRPKVNVEYEKYEEYGLVLEKRGREGRKEGRRRGHRDEISDDASSETLPC